MKAVDTNILVYAHREETRQHISALRLLSELAQGDVPWGIPSSCITEFLGVVTHERIFSPPTPLDTAIDSIDALLNSPSARLLLPDSRYWAVLEDVLLNGRATGNIVFDAQIVALCLTHGVDTLISEDRGIRRFSGIAVRPIG